MNSQNEASGENKTEQARITMLGRMAGLSFVTGFSGAIMPGTLLVLVIEQTALQGFWASIWIITGHALLELVLLVCLILGLRAVISRPKVRAAIGIIGGAALLYMGADMLRHAWHLSLSLDAASQTAWTWPKLIFLGAAVCAANPYFTGWWGTIGVGQLAHMAPKTPGEYLAFYLGHEAADYTWYAFVAVLIITGRQWLTDSVYHALIIACAALIILLSLWFIISGIKLVANARQTRDRVEAQTSNQA